MIAEDLGGLDVLDVVNITPTGCKAAATPAAECLFGAHDALQVKDSPAHRIALRSVVASRDNDDIGRILVRNGKEHMSEGSDIVCIAHVPHRPRDVDREPLTRAPANF